MDVFHTSVFDDKQEIRRLAVQTSLLRTYEQPVYQQVMAGRSNLRLLDVGCNNGSKAVDRFTCGAIARVMGLECLGDVAAQAQATYGNDVFSFHQCDVESPDFSEQLTQLMAQSGVAGFDIIHVSFLLMHLENPQALLKTLRGFLAPGGRLIVVEADDSKSALSPDPENLLGGFLDILRLDPFSGDRLCGSRVPALLEQAGYQQIKLENSLIRAERTERQKKQVLFTIFFSYLPEDVRLLQEQSPGNAQYALWAEWLKAHFDALRDAVLAEAAQVSVGLTIVTCAGGHL